MSKDVKIGIVATLCMTFISSGAFIYSAIASNDVPTTVEVVEATVMDISAQPMTVVTEPEYPLSQEEIDLIALVTMAEAEGECEEGKRLVIDTILNRADHERFPDTVTEVIYQANQFSSMWNGRIDRCYVMDDIVQLVKEELIDRTNSEVIFFMAGEYSTYGTPLFQVEHHYFSSYD